MLLCRICPLLNRRSKSHISSQDPSFLAPNPLCPFLQLVSFHKLIQHRYLLIAKSKNFNGFDKHIMENVKLIDASPTGTVDFEFHIDEQYTNINGVMHGGAAGVIFDMCTTTALGPLAKPGFWEYGPFPLLSFSFLLPYLPKPQLTNVPLSFLGGVTRTLNISYLRAIPMGSLFLLPIFTPLAQLFFHPHTLLLLMAPPRNHNPSPQRSLSSRPHNGHDPRNHDQPRRQNYLLHV